jgi:hypothetical protein
MKPLPKVMLFRVSFWILLRHWFSQIPYEQTLVLSVIFELDTL